MQWQDKRWEPDCEKIVRVPLFVKIFHLSHIGWNLFTTVSCWCLPGQNMSKKPGWGRVAPELGSKFTNVSNGEDFYQNAKVYQRSLVFQSSTLEYWMTRRWTIRGCTMHTHHATAQFMADFGKPDGKDAVWGIGQQFGGVPASHQCTHQHSTWAISSPSHTIFQHHSANTASFGKDSTIRQRQHHSARTA